MKITAKNEICPKCGESDIVMGMKTGNANLYGCLTCRNFQGLHLKMGDAKKAWKRYKETFETQRTQREGE